MTAVLAQVHEVIRAADEDLALAACVQISLAGPHLAPGSQPAAPSPMTLPHDPLLRRARQPPRGGRCVEIHAEGRESAWAVPLRQGALNETRTRSPGSAVTASWAKGGRSR